MAKKLTFLVNREKRQKCVFDKTIVFMNIFRKTLLLSYITYYYLQSHQIS